VDLSKYNLKDILLSAIKSEIDSEVIYRKLSEKVKNDLLKDRLIFLAGEEKKHKHFLEQLYEMRFPGEKKSVDYTPVPLPKVTIESEDDPISLVFEDAMKAEKATSDFYSSIKSLFDEDKIKKMLDYLSAMEDTHYNILKIEYDNMKIFEDYHNSPPFVHIGP